MQWRIVVAILFALIVALFAVINVHAEPIHYLFGVSYVPLVLIILGAALLGGLSVATFGVVGRIRLLRELKKLRKEMEDVRGGSEVSSSPLVPLGSANSYESSVISEVRTVDRTDDGEDSSSRLPD